MEHLELALLALFFLLFANFSGKLEKSIFSGPMIFAFVGIIFSPLIFGELNINIQNNAVKFVAEFTLIILLFTDASRINLSLLKKEHKLPLKLLSIGLPLTIILGAVAAHLIFDNIGITSAIILAIILAPTDAALGQAVVSYEKIPPKIRQAINVESGLNDGIALPFLLFFIAIAASSAGNSAIDNIDYWILFTLKQIGFGILVGAVLGYASGKFVSYCQEKGIASKTFTDLSAVVISIFAFAAAEVIHGNGFVSAFVAGLTLGNTAKHICEGVYEFAETEGQMFTLLTFLFFGVLIVIPAFQSITIEMFIYAILSLTLIRIIPVFISFIGEKLNFESKLFISWFGPRGVATILYGILILDNALIPNKELIFNTAMITVVLSIILHGVSAMPWSVAYSNRINKLKDNSETDEHQVISEMPVKTIKKFSFKKG